MRDWRVHADWIPGPCAPSSASISGSAGPPAAPARRTGVPCKARAPESTPWVPLSRLGATCRRRQKHAGLSPAVQDSADRRAWCGPGGYRPAVAVFGRSATRSWLNSVLSLCAPHWGQRSADDQAPHRWHALCVRFGNYFLTRPWLSHLALSGTPQRSGPQEVNQYLPPNVATAGAADNIIDQFHPNWKPGRYSLHRVPGHEYQRRQPGEARPTRGSCDWAAGGAKRNGRVCFARHADGIAIAKRDLR